MKINMFKKISMSITWVWLMIFAVVPNLIVIVVSLLSHDPQSLYRLPLTLDNFAQIMHWRYGLVLLRSTELALMTTLISLIIAYPFSYFIAQAKRFKTLLLILVILPFVFKIVIIA